MEKKAEFLSNKPLGEDLFDGQSQDKVAMALMQHIQDVDSIAEPKDEDEEEKVLPRIIGIEGKWGSGKSNTLLQLKKKLGKDYYFFTYDAWGNQEDLQRRSILQLLTNRLIKEEKLEGDTQIKRFSSAIDVRPELHTCSWQDRVDNLTSRKSSTRNITVPSIYDSTKYFVLMIVITGILVPLLNSIKVSATPCWYTYLATVLAFVPLIGYCLLMRSMKKKRAKAVKPDEKAKYIGWSWHEMWQMYQTTGRTDTSTYTVSDLEPSVTEFRDWMTDLSNALVDNTKLVIVFDNMDRLPMEKVRQLWSSIQTFFADKGYRRVWCIIPFDREHLANAFNDAKDKETLTNYFIEKTFPVVYRIPEPIITDYKVVFDRLFERAFGKTDDQELINRCFRLRNPQPNIREIISFINKLVSLTNQWEEKIRLSSMALFLLNQKEILQSPESSIVKREYLKGLESLFDQTDELDTEISALAYGVDIKDAGQLPMKNLINQALNNSEVDDFADYATKNVHFYSILREVVDSMDAALLNNAINDVAVLTGEKLNKQDAANLEAVWRKLASLYKNSKEKETAFRNEVKTLMIHCANKVSIGNHFLKLFTNSENTHKGAEWYHVYKDFSVFSKGLGLTIELPERQMVNTDFVEYVRAAKEDYKNYPIKCANDELNTFFQEQIANNDDVSDIVKLTAGDKQYDYNKLKEAARKMIEGQEVTSNNFESVIKVLKILGKEPLKLNLDSTYLSGLQYEGELKPDYRVLLMLAKKEISGLSDTDYEAMAKVVFKYDTAKKIWDSCQTVNTTVYGQFTAYLIKNKLHDGKVTDAKDVVNEMVTIVTKTGVDRIDVIQYLNDWGRKGLTQEEEQIDFAAVLPQEAWIDALVADKNGFSKALLEKFYKDCGSKAWNQFMDGSNVWIGGNYWSKIMRRFVKDADFWRTNPSNAVEIVNHLIDGICGRTIVESTMDEELLTTLLSRVKFTSVSTKVNEAMDKFASNTYSISLFIFQKLHHYFEQTRNHEVVFLNKVLKPIIGQDAVQSIILGDSKRYEKLLQDYIDQASDLKNELVKLHGSSSNEEFKALIERLDILPKENSGDGSGEE
jgi:KAP family P-loop domain.